MINYGPMNQFTGLCNKKFRQCWTSRHEQVLEEIKVKIASCILLNYPGPNLPYGIIKPDTSHYQLGAIIKQASLFPLACFSHKLVSSPNETSPPLRKRYSLALRLSKKTVIF
jgi:hypothetical protein